MFFQFCPNRAKYKEAGQSSNSFSKKNNKIKIQSVRFYFKESRKEE